jgi:hypothetical protein
MWTLIVVAILNQPVISITTMQADYASKARCEEVKKIMLTSQAQGELVHGWCLEKKESGK